VPRFSKVEDNLSLLYSASANLNEAHSSPNGRSFTFLFITISPLIDLFLVLIFNKFIPLYLTLSGVTHSLHLPFTTSGALLTLDGTLLPPWAPSWEGLGVVCVGSDTVNFVDC